MCFYDNWPHIKSLKVAFFESNTFFIGIVFTGNSIYTELKLYKSNKKPTEISASMYRSLIWHSDVYKDNVFLYDLERYL